MTTLLPAIPGSPLRHKLIGDIKMRHFSIATQRDYRLSRATVAFRALAHHRGRKYVRLDGRLQPVDPEAVLHPPHRLRHRLDVGHRPDLLVVVHPAPQVVVHGVERVLADAHDRRADLRQAAHELTLVAREEGLDEDDVHAPILALPMTAEPR
jgi:hypothetical protein